MSIKNQLFQLFDVSEKQADFILSKLVVEDLDKGDSFLEQGKKCTKMGFIESGYCRVYRLTKTKEVTQWIGGNGYFVTDLASFLYNQNASWNIEAITPMRLWTLTKSDYLDFETNVPDWNLFEKRFTAKCFMQMENRIFDFVSLSAEERYMKFFEMNKAMFNQVPLQYIASVLGMSPETLSRLRKKCSS